MQDFLSPTAAPMPLPAMPFQASGGPTSAFSSTGGEIDVDIAVIGASVAGLFAAQALARLGYRCALVGPDPAVSRQQDGFDQRIFAISPASWDWMEQQGLTAAIDAARVGVIDRMHLEAASWSSPQPIVLDAYRAAVDQLALTVEQSELIAVGQQAIAMTGVLRLKDALVSLRADQGGKPASRRSKKQAAASAIAKRLIRVTSVKTRDLVPGFLLYQLIRESRENRFFRPACG